MLLTHSDRALLWGEAGAAVATAMELLVSTGEAEGAPELLDISGARVTAAGKTRRTAYPVNRTWDLCRNLAFLPIKDLK